MTNGWAPVLQVYEITHSSSVVTTDWLDVREPIRHDATSIGPG